ncbi:hypothetical protein, partial [Kaarinaea lacus]
MSALLLLIAGCQQEATPSGSASPNNPPPGGSAPPGSNTSPGASQVQADLVTADTGDIIAVRVNNTVVLDGSASWTNLSEPLTYDWSFTAVPTGSRAVLQNPSSVNPSFLADVAGTYRAQLVVSAGGISSQRAIAFVEVTTGGNYTGDKRVHTSYPATCDYCHDGHLAQGDGPVAPVAGKSGNHMATSNVCEACHTTFGFELIRYMDHQEVFGRCSSCHDGVRAMGKSQFHVATNAECDNCHTIDSFLPLDPDGRFDHSGITRNCDTCHNGTIAPGKAESHIPVPAGSDCKSCHTTEQFVPAFVDHSGITSNCESCHNGTDAIGQPAGHPAMAVDCSVCHSTTLFSLGGVFNHRVVDPTIQPCSGCHNDNNTINARGTASATNHVATAEDCYVCHGIGGGSFADGIFDHTGIINNCSACHGEGGDGSGPGKNANHIPTIEDCSVCHSPG